MGCLPGRTQIGSPVAQGKMLEGLKQVSSTVPLALLEESL